MNKCSLTWGCNKNFFLRVQPELLNHTQNTYWHLTWFSIQCLQGVYNCGLRFVSKPFKYYHRKTDRRQAEDKKKFSFIIRINSQHWTSSWSSRLWMSWIHSDRREWVKSLPVSWEVLNGRILRQAPDMTATVLWPHAWRSRWSLHTWSLPPPFPRRLS